MPHPRITATRWWKHGPIRGGRVGLLLLAGAGAWAAPAAGDRAQVAPSETIYVAMYGTRQTQLRGHNPDVGFFTTQDAGATWHHTGWTQGKACGLVTVEGTAGRTLFGACGNGVQRTIDGGKSWRIMTDWRVTEIQDVAVNPRRPRQVFAVSPYGVYRSDDLGETWSRSDAGVKGIFVSAVQFDRAQPGRMWLGSQEGLFRSDDNGLHWQPTAVTGRVRCIRQSPLDPHRWAIATVGQGVAVSADNGDSWRFAAEPTTAAIYQCEFDPRHVDRLYAGGWETGVLVSEDFGRTWRAASAKLGPVSIHGLAISRRRDGLIFAGTLGDGVIESTDGGKSWQPVASAIFGGGQIWDIYVEGER